MSACRHYEEKVNACVLFLTTFGAEKCVTVAVTQAEGFSVRKGTVNKDCEHRPYHKKTYG